MNPFFEGLALQASLIAALGAQNVFVIESATFGRRPYLVAAVCLACDAALIAFGALGAGGFLSRSIWARAALGGLGAAFLGAYGWRKLREAFLGRSALALDGPADRGATDARAVVLAALAFSLLNPHVYVDTVLLVGGYSSRFSAGVDRAWFSAGATAFSALWFFGLTWGGARLSAVVRARRESGGRALPLESALNWASGAIMIALAIKLGGDVAAWIRSS